MDGAKDMHSLQKALGAAGKAVSEYKVEAVGMDCDRDEPFDDLRERIAQLEAKCARLAEAAGRALEPKAKAKCARGAWHARLLLAKGRARLRAREAAEGGWRVGRGVCRIFGSIGPRAPPLSGPTQLAHFNGRIGQGSMG